MLGDQCGRSRARLGTSVLTCQGGNRFRLGHDFGQRPENVQRPSFLHVFHEYFLGNPAVEQERYEQCSENLIYKSTTVRQSNLCNSGPEDLTIPIKGSINFLLMFIVFVCGGGCIFNARSANVPNHENRKIGILE